MRGKLCHPSDRWMRRVSEEDMKETNGSEGGDVGEASGGSSGQSS